MLMLSWAMWMTVAAAADDPREGRNDLTLSVGPLLRTDRGKPAHVKSGVAVEAEVPLGWRLNLRLDYMSGQDAQDQLRIQGPKAAIMCVYHQPIDIFGIDAGVGPSAWFGRSAWWDEAYPGPWPGYRVALGGSYRPHANVGGRLEFGADQTFGTYSLVNGQTSGWDLRLMVTGWLP